MKLSLGKSKRSAEQQLLENMVIPTPSLYQRIIQSWFDAIPSLWGTPGGFVIETKLRSTSSVLSDKITWIT